MNILILHRTPFTRIGYDSVIDHWTHDVIYMGTERDLENIPESLRCKKIVRSSIKSYVDDALYHFELKSLDRIISLSEKELLTAAHLRKALQVGGASCEQTERARNKLLMKSLLSSKGIKVPLAAPLFESVRANTVNWKGKTIIKPLDGVASENVVEFNNSSTALNAVIARTTGIPSIDHRSCEQSLSGFELEEFIDRPIVHFDGLIVDGLPILLSSSRYIGTCLGFANGKGLASYQFDASTHMKIWVADVVQNMELADGAFHLEAFFDDDSETLTFLEIANRVGGGGVNESIYMKTGINLQHWHIRLSLGEKFDAARLATISDAYFGYFLFPSHTLSRGDVSMTGHNYFIDHPSVIQYSLIENLTSVSSSLTYYADELPFAGIVKTQGPEQSRLLLVDLLQNVCFENFNRTEKEIST